jgi:D-arabinitol dehydrogenase (NADP+)
LYKELTLNAVVYSGPRQFTVRDVSRPEPGPGEILVRSTVTGVCGTDQHIHDGGFFAAYPLIPGHEIVGVVEVLGPDVVGRYVGQQVAVDNATNCGTCDACGRDEPLFCTNFHSLGVNAPGGFAEYVVVRADKCFPAEDIAAEAAVVAEPLACAVHGVDVLGLRPGSDVALVGSGPTGLLLAQLLLHGGAARMTVAGPTKFKLDLAESFGVDRTMLVDRDNPAATAKGLQGLAPKGYDVAIDATGSASVMQYLPGLVRDGGTVFVYGMADEDARVSWSPYEIFRRQLTVKGSFAQIDCFDRSLAYLRSGRVKTEGIVTDRFPLDAYKDALSALRRPTTLKAIIDHRL